VISLRKARLKIMWFYLGAGCFFRIRSWRIYPTLALHGQICWWPSVLHYLTIDRRQGRCLGVGNSKLLLPTLPGVCAQRRTRAPLEEQNNGLWGNLLLPAVGRGGNSCWERHTRGFSLVCKGGASRPDSCVGRAETTQISILNISAVTQSVGGLGTR